MLPGRLALLGIGAGLLAAACASLNIVEPTPVPGAAATAARAAATAIPTPARLPSPVAASPLPQPSPAVSPAPSPRPAVGVADADVAAVRRELERVFGSPGLPGIEELLFERVSTSTPQGGEVLSRADAAAWLRGLAGPGIQVTNVERSALAVVLQVLTEG